YSPSSSFFPSQSSSDTQGERNVRREAKDNPQEDEEERQKKNAVGSPADQKKEIDKVLAEQSFLLNSQILHRHNLSTNWVLSPSSSSSSPSLGGEVEDVLSRGAGAISGIVLDRRLFRRLRMPGCMSSTSSSVLADRCFIALVKFPRSFCFEPLPSLSSSFLPSSSSHADAKRNKDGFSSSFSFGEENEDLEEEQMDEKKKKRKEEKRTRERSKGGAILSASSSSGETEEKNEEEEDSESETGSPSRSPSPDLKKKRKMKKEEERKRNFSLSTDISWTCSSSSPLDDEGILREEEEYQEGHAKEDKEEESFSSFPSSSSFCLHVVSSLNVKSIEKYIHYQISHSLHEKLNSSSSSSSSSSFSLFSGGRGRKETEKDRNLFSKSLGDMKESITDDAPSTLLAGKRHISTQREKEENEDQPRHDSSSSLLSPPHDVGLITRFCGNPLDHILSLDTAHSRLFFAQRIDRKGRSSSRSRRLLDQRQEEHQSYSREEKKKRRRRALSESEVEEGTLLSQESKDTSVETRPSPHEAEQEEEERENLPGGRKTSLRSEKEKKKKEKDEGADGDARGEKASPSSSPASSFLPFLREKMRRLSSESSFSGSQKKEEKSQDVSSSSPRRTASICIASIVLDEFYRDITECREVREIPASIDMTMIPIGEASLHNESIKKKKKEQEEEKKSNPKGEKKKKEEEKSEQDSGISSSSSSSSSFSHLPPPWRTVWMHYDAKTNSLVLFSFETLRRQRSFSSSFSSSSYHS
ncbi:hypothetical protein CSUI_005487, partial [Cystoisospora suis]